MKHNKRMVKHLHDPKIGLVDSRMTNTGSKKEGISIQEKGYINMEGNLKYFEGELFNCLIDPLRMLCNTKIITP